MRGGTLDDDGAQRLDQGLSPRARGNLRVGDVYFKNAGSIPACAGEPMNRLPHPPEPGVYPRVRGGTAIDAGA